MAIGHFGLALFSFYMLYRYASKLSISTLLACESGPAKNNILIACKRPVQKSCESLSSCQCRADPTGARGRDEGANCPD